MELFLTLLLFLLISAIGLYLFILRAPKKVDIEREILSIGETQLGREINAVIRNMSDEREKRTYLEKLNEKIEQSQTGMTLPMYLVIMAVAMLIVFFVSNFILGVPALAILFSLLGFFVPNMVVNQMRQKNIEFFDTQLVGVLRRLSSLLRTGTSLKQGLQDVSTSLSVPTKVRAQFKMVLQKIEAGYNLEPALFEMYERIGSESLLYLAVTVDVLRKQGADLPEVFDTISQNISRRNMSERRVKATLAQLKASSNMLSAMPFFIGGILWLMQPHYFDPMFESLTGRIIMFVIIGVMASGFFVFRKLSNIK